jgi:glycosyltransferase involved in cell wall biosynthesis
MSGVITLSVVLANYNHGRFLAESLSSILNQTRLPDQLIVTDDASTDNSIEVIKQYLDHLPWVQVVRHEKNQGIYKTFREQFSLATGNYLIACASDDFWEPNCFATLIEALEKHPQAAFACCDSNRLYDSTGELKKIRVLHGLTETTYLNGVQAKRFMQNNLLFNTVLYRSSLFKNEGGYHPDGGGDADAVINEILSAVYGFVLVPEILSTFRDTGANYSLGKKNNPELVIKTMQKSSRLMRQLHPEVFNEKYIQSRQRLHICRYVWVYINELNKHLAIYRNALSENTGLLIGTVVNVFYGVLWCGTNAFKNGVCFLLLPHLLLRRARLILANGFSKINSIRKKQLMLQSSI